MKRFSLILFIIFSSCQTPTLVQSYAIQNTDGASNDSLFWVFENDTVKIIYDFYADHGKMSFVIFNKSKVPLYIDWRKSSFVANDVKNDYWKDNVVTKGQYSGRSNSVVFRRPTYGLFSFYSGLSAASHYGYSESVMSKPERITSIPPNSKHFKVDYTIVRSPVVILKPIQEESVFLKLPNTTRKQEVKTYRSLYTNENTPLSFRNFLALSFTESFDKEFYIDNHFYVSSVIEVPQSVYKQRLWPSSKYNYPYVSGKAFFITIPTAKSYAVRSKRCEYIYPESSYTAGKQCSAAKKDGNKYCLYHASKK